MNNKKKNRRAHGAHWVSGHTREANTARGGRGTDLSVGKNGRLNDPVSGLETRLFSNTSTATGAFVLADVLMTDLDLAAGVKRHGSETQAA